MAEILGESPEESHRVHVDAAFAQVTDILNNVHGMDQINSLADMAGGADFYNALIASSGQFMKEHPRIYEGRAPAPHVTALWVGLIVGANAARQSLENPSNPS